MLGPALRDKHAGVDQLSNSPKSGWPGQLVAGPPSNDGLRDKKPHLPLSIPKPTPIHMLHFSPRSNRNEPRARSCVPCLARLCGTSMRASINSRTRQKVGGPANSWPGRSATRSPTFRPQSRNQPPTTGMSPDPVSIQHEPPGRCRTVQQRAEISDTDRPENAAPGPRNCGVGNRQAIRGSRPRSAKHPIRGCLRRCLAPNSRVRASVSCRRAGVSDRSDNSPEPNRPRFRPYPSGRTTGRVVRSRVSRAKLG
jgi:hypothetical protein